MSITFKRHSPKQSNFADEIISTLKLTYLTIFLFSLLPLYTIAQQPDSISRNIDSARVTDSSIVKDSLRITDSIKGAVKNPVDRDFGTRALFEKNFLLNTSDQPAVFIQRERKTNSKDALFYSMAMVAFLFAVLKFLYARYFSNLFRVFFNTSLRQTQLTDQLLQAKLPSLLFNFFFVLIGGWYICLLLNHFGLIREQTDWKALLICSLSLMVIYFMKFVILKFTGWVTGFRQEADTYIFIVYLINKIVAICLLPLLIIIAFSAPNLVRIALILSYVIIGLMILMRFIRAYGLLQNRIKVSGFHFFIYVIGIEIVPILVIYKAALFFVSKNL